METTVTTRWMKHREKQGVWHLASKPAILDQTGGMAWVTSCRGDMLFGSIGPIVQQFEGLPKSPKCTQLFLDAKS
jgi:hypothetical protein